MPIKIGIREGEIASIEVDSVEEAIQFLRNFNGRRDVRVADRVFEARMAPKERPRPLPPSARKLVQSLVEHPQGMKSTAIAKALEIEPRGLGPVVVSLIRWAKRLELAKRDVIIGERVRENGRAVRLLKLGAPLMKRIKEGGLQLE